MLVAKGASTELEADAGLTAITLAAQHGHAAVVAELISLGAKVDHTADNGVTPLHLACAQGHTDVVRALIAGGADVDRQTNSGYTALEFAALHNHLPAAKVLCAHGAARGDAFDEAVAHGHHETADWLVSSSSWTSRLHHLGEISAEEATALLRDGADIHASLGAGHPSPLTLARSAKARGERLDGTAAEVVLCAAEPWSPSTHRLMRDEQRQRARELLFLGYSVARAAPADAEGSLLDIWRGHVLPLALSAC